MSWLCAELSPTISGFSAHSIEKLIIIVTLVWVVNSHYLNANQYSVNLAMKRKSQSKNQLKHRQAIHFLMRYLKAEKTIVKQNFE